MLCSGLPATEREGKADPEGTVTDSSLMNQGLGETQPRSNGSHGLTHLSGSIPTL